MEVFSTILILVFLVSMSGILTKLVPFQAPLPLIQILMGCILAGFHIYEEDFEPELFLLLFIPPLLFDDGRKTAINDFVHNAREIVSLALVLVLITIIALGFILYKLLPDIPLPVAMALAAVLSPTDAVALSGIVSKGRIAKDKMEIIEGEAMMNDASGLVGLKFAIAIGLGTMVFNVWSISVAFIFSAVGGLIVGALVTWVYIVILTKINKITNSDAAIQIVLLFILPFAVYLIAEHMLHTSGILAAVSAGMTVRYSGVMKKAPLTTRFQSESAWTMLTFVFNGVVFTLLGLQLPKILVQTLDANRNDHNISMFSLILIVVGAYIALMVTRYLWLYIMKIIPKPFFMKKPLAFRLYTQRDLLISTFAGVRGAITLAGVLSIPYSIYPSGHYELVFIAMGVILLSLITSVLILPILLRGSVIIENKAIIDEMNRVKGSMAEGAITSVEKMQSALLGEHNNQLDTEIINEVGARVIASLRRRTGFKNLEEKSLKTENLEKRMRLVAIGSERASLYKLKASKEISEDAFDRLLDDLDIYEQFLMDG